ncbi:MAG: hypothetical protein HY796_01830 [Elusimicrobia bacterium]|nr:hypothetical protein [Elusimicrobiota bacterium]
MLPGNILCTRRGVFFNTLPGWSEATQFNCIQQDEGEISFSLKLPLALRFPRPKGRGMVKIFAAKIFNNDLCRFIYANEI